MKIAVPKHNRLPLTLTTEGLGASHVIISTRRHENFVQTNGMTLCHLQNLQYQVWSAKRNPVHLREVSRSYTGIWGLPSLFAFGTGKRLAERAGHIKLTR